MQILSLEINNILSIERASLSLDNTGLVLVEGWNHDTQRHNGAGKTAIFNCLSFALYDQLPRKITASEILRRGTKTGYVSCNIMCGSDTWTVKRYRPKGVEFYKNSIRQDITQEEFEKNLKLNYEQFMLTMYTPQANSKSNARFLNSPDSTKKDFLLKLLNLNEFTELKKASDDKVKNLQLEIDLNKHKIETINAKKSAYIESIVDIETFKDSIVSLEKEITVLESNINDFTNVNKPDLSKFESLEDSLKIKLNEIVKAKTKKEIIFEKYKTIEKHINHDFNEKKCSECGTLLTSEEAKKNHELKKELLKKELENIKNELEALDLITVKEQAIKETFVKLKDKIKLESQSYQDAQLSIANTQSLIMSKKSKIDSFKKSINNNLLLETKIKDLDNDLLTINTKLNTLNSNLEIYKTLSQFYSPTGAQAYVLDSIVDSFNENVQKYIDLMSPNMSYVLNLFKETSKGDVVAKFSETLTKNGKDTISVGSLSGGEEKGISLCVDFALLDVLESHFSISLNPIILDEPFDGLDSIGKEIVVDLLQKISTNRQIIIVDHSSETKSMFSKVIKVELKNDISTVSIVD
jgi:DNA repair exonuclease SbcCD ATPase subunit